LALRILDTPPEEEFDAIVRLAAKICDVPIALVSLVDESRQWFKARVGLEAAETSRDVSYCGHAIVGPETMVVPDASADPRFVDNPLRTGEPHVEFYAGVPLRLSSGHAVGTLCVIDHAPRSLTPAQQTALEALAAQVVRLLELRRAAMLQRDAVAAMRSESLRPPASTVAPPPRSQTFSRGAFLLACVMGLTAVLATLRVRDLVLAAGDERLERSAERSAGFLRERTEGYAQILRGTGALFRASDRVSREEFRSYVDSLGLPRNYPGLLGLGFAERVPRSQLESWLAEARSEHPGLEVVTRDQADELVINRLVEPMERNAPALGFDIASDPARKRALDAALASDDVSMSAQVKLRQDATHPGFALYLPVPASSGGAHRGGWVFAVVRGVELVKGAPQATGAGVALRIVDERGTALLEHGTDDGGLSRTTLLEVADQRFAIEVRPGESFYSASERSEPWIILVLGLCATLLTYALATSVRKIEGHSQALAVRMTRSLRRGERELRAVIDGTTDLVVTFTQKGQLTLTNRAFRDTLGYDSKDLASMAIEDIVSAEARDAFHAAHRHIAGSEEPAHLETTFLTRSGRVIEVEGALSVALENEQQVTRAIFRNVTARREAERALRAANEALERLSTTDPLTGVANRRLFDLRLAEEISRVGRHGGELSIALVDVDCFKLYNDTYGHQQGDECLRKVAACLRASARRSGELAARYGGEEFALVLPGSSADVALLLADQLRESVQKLAVPHAKHPLGMVTISVGVASFDAHAMKGSDALIAAADTALYRAKHAGRNRVELAA
jgi:diguanylate cyclase (GGDEF)-like protein/PAS domain S-box-containing protein